ncbi:MAG: hypothetical protein ACYSUF_00430 [Planctomycetota bacterium]|jgi:hypothetical protein
MIPECFKPMTVVSTADFADLVNALLEAPEPNPSIYAWARRYLPVAGKSGNGQPKYRRDHAQHIAALIEAHRIRNRVKQELAHAG